MRTIGGARKQIAQYIDYYNTKPPHSALFYLTSEDFLNARVEKKIRLRDQKLYQAKLNRMDTKHTA